MTESLSQLHYALVDALLQSRHQVPDQPVTVAEIYQDLIPYRTVRSSVGFALNEDYEHALLQLLAGEGGFARVEPPEVRAELQTELKASNPNVGVFRNYAACDVFVTVPKDFQARRASRRDTGRVAVVSEHGPQPASAQQPLRPGNPMERAAAVPPAAPQPGAAPPRASASAPAAMAPRPVISTSAPSTATSASRSSCTQCKQALPSARSASFCPYCGHDQTKRVCASCGEGFEAGWKFCIACGSPAT